MLAAAANAIRATYESGEPEPGEVYNLRSPEERADARIWLSNWQISPTTYPYGGSAALYDALNPVTPHPELADQLQQTGLHPYPPGSLGFYLQSAIVLRVWKSGCCPDNIFGATVRDQNIEIARSINKFYDLNGYHTPTGRGTDVSCTARLTPLPDRIAVAALLSLTTSRAARVRTIKKSASSAIVTATLRLSVVSTCCRAAGTQTCNVAK